MRELVLIHLHVPKCAGGAVNQVMRAYFGERILHASGDKAVNVLEERKNDRFDAVIGHYNWGLHTYFDRPTRYFSAVREPIDRVCSFYNFAHTQPRADLHKPLKRHLPDLDALNADTFRLMPPIRFRWCNTMCRAYSGFQDVNNMTWDEIWPTIEGRIASGHLVVRDLAGITRFLEEEGIHEGPLPFQKVTKVDRFDDYVVARPHTLKPTTIDLLRARNQHDLRLMDALRAGGHVDG